MSTKYDCTLGGTSLSSLDESICVLDVCEAAPKLRLSAAGWQNLLQRERESLSVQVDFAIQEPDVLRRSEVFRRVLDWAENGGFLTLPTRKNQRLQILCTDAPALHAEDWTETLRITFTTTAVPYWEAAALSSVSTSASARLTLSGNTASAPVDVLFTNNGSEPLTQVQLVCGDTQMTFTGLAIGTGATFSLRYADGRLTAEANGNSLLRCLTPESDDLLLAPCGKACTVSISADQPVTATFSGRGRYL